MCLAEAGYDPSAAWPADVYEGGVTIDAYVDPFVGWRATALGNGVGVCWPCFRAQLQADPWLEVVAPCSHPVDPFCAEDAEVAW